MSRILSCCIDKSIVADTCAAINGQTNTAEHAGHFKSLGRGFLIGLSGYRNPSPFFCAADDYTSPRGYTCEHRFSLKSVQVYTHRAERLEGAIDRRKEKKSRRTARHHARRQVRTASKLFL